MKTLLSLLIYAVLLVIGYLVVDYIILPDYTNHGEEYDMVDLAELSVDKARDTLSINEMELIISDSSFSPVIPKDHIISQLPKAYSRVKKGRRVYVTVSRGNQPAIVPDLTGISERDAKFRLEALNLFVKDIRRRYSSRLPKDVVMGQSPAPKSILTAGDSLIIYISNGTNRRAEPLRDFTGKLLSNVRKQIEEYGLTIIVETEEGDGNYLSGTIIRQSLLPNRVLTEDKTTITIWVVK